MKMAGSNDLGYLFELFVHRNKVRIWRTDFYPDQFTTSYKIKNEVMCALPSSRELYTVEKHSFQDLLSFGSH